LLFLLCSLCQLCTLTDGCYDFYIGSGRSAATDPRSAFSLCGRTGVLPAVTTLCIRNNRTECSPAPFKQLKCPSPDEFLHSIVKVDLFGDGWGANIRYTIQTLEDSRKVASGGLEGGDFGVDHLCLQVGCYSITLPYTWAADEVVWILCGFEGGAPANAFTFCVKADGTCFFDAEPGYNDDDEAGPGPFDDDDFVPNPKHRYTFPTAAPTISTFGELTLNLLT